MVAKKCDRCGNLYELYNTKESKNNINGILTANIDNHQQYFRHGPYDLCPYCSNEFMDWFNSYRKNESTNE